MPYENLFKPIKIGSVEIKNRYGMGPYCCLHADWTGMVSDDDIAMWVARAKGGVGLIIVGSVMATEFGKKVAPHPWIHMTGIEHVPGLALLAESIHLCGAKAFIQILPAAGSRARPVSGMQPVAPSANLSYQFGADKSLRSAETILEERLTGRWLKEKYTSYPEAREITLVEMRSLVEDCARNAKLAVLAGFDGIEIHTCHHYIMDQFRDPRMNQRDDSYGGNRENRHRLLIELVDAVSRSVKEERKDFVVGVRVGTACAGEGGYTLEDTKWLAGKLQEIGIDYWHPTFGFPPTPETAFESQQDGGFLQWAKELKTVLKVPVLTPSIHDPVLAEKAVAEGWTDMVMAVRPLLADPDLPNKVREGRIADITRCKKEGYCWVTERLGLPRRCSVNPELGREKYNPRYQIKEGFKGGDMLPYVLRKYRE